MGATATGKTAVAELVAERLGAEIVCADSRQLYRELEIGTGKPTPAERAAQPHHLFELLELGERASAGSYAGAAATACADVAARGRVPLLVGGSGLYLRALQGGLAEEPPHDPVLRARLATEAALSDTPQLHARLAAVDPETAARLHPGDRQRVLRALEVFEASGRPLSWWHRERPGPASEASWIIVELVVPPAALEPRIEGRTRAMFAGGLIEEVEALLRAGHERALRRLRALGYDEAMGVLAGAIGRAEALGRTNRRTRQLAKRQRTWFRHQVDAERIDAASEPAERLAEAVVGAFRRTAG